MPSPDIRRVLRLCAACADGIRDEAMRYDPELAESLRALANDIERAAFDWATEPEGAR